MSSELGDIAKASARGSLFLFLGKTSSTIVLALSSILVARLLGPENYGLYSVAMIVPAFLIALSDLGISPALTRFSAYFRSKKQDQRVVGLIQAGIIFKFVFSIILSLVLLLISESIATWVLRRPGIGLLISFTSLYLVGQAIFTTLNSVFIGLDKTENSILLMNTQAVARTVASPLLIILGIGVIGAISGTGLSFLLAAGVGIAVLLLRVRPNFYGNPEDKIDFFQAIRLIIPYGAPLYLSTLIISLLTQYQRYILALFVSNTEIGNYITAMNFSVLMQLLTYPITTSLFPAFSKLNVNKDRNVVEKMFKLSVKYTSLLLIPASLAVAVFSEELVYTLYGSQYGLAPSYLALYILSFLCAGLGTFVVGSLFNGQGDTRATLRLSLISLGLTVPLALILTFLFGVYGLVASVLVTSLLSSTYGLFLARKKYAVTVDWVSSLRTGVAALSSALLVYIFTAFVSIPIPIFRLVVGGSIFVASFLVFAPLLKVISEEDTKNLHELLKELTPIYPIAKWILNLEEKILALNIAL